MNKFRIKQSDTIKATLIEQRSGRLIATVYDSEFTTINQVVRALFNKVRYTTAKKVNVAIHNLDKEQSKHFVLNVNKAYN